MLITIRELTEPSILAVPNVALLQKLMTKDELTQSLNLARALDLIVSSRVVNGVLHVYNAAGQSRSWDSFISDFPLERMQAMAARNQPRQAS